MSKADALRRIAFENISKKIETYEDFERAVGDWWRRKYSLPDTDPRYLNKYFEDMVVEYFEDQFTNDAELLHAYKHGYESAEQMEKERLKDIMGDEFTEEVSYFQEPTKAEKKTGLSMDEHDLSTLGGDEEEEIIAEFD